MVREVCCWGGKKQIQNLVGHPKALRCSAKADLSRVNNAYVNPSGQSFSNWGVEMSQPGKPYFCPLRGGGRESNVVVLDSGGSSLTHLAVMTSWY